MAVKKPRTQAPPASRAPKLANSPQEQKLAFSFRYWTQIKNFDLSKCTPKWFADLINRLKALGACEIQELLTSGTTKKGHRFHEIDWREGKVSIKLSDLSWVPEEYRDPEQHSWFQFQISQSRGRIHGFLEGSVFHVVLMDPDHKLYPTESISYSVVPFQPEKSDAEAILSEIKRLQLESSCNSSGSCPLQVGFMKTAGGIDWAHFAIKVEQCYVEELQKLISSGKAKGVSHVLEMGILSLSDSD